MRVIVSKKSTMMKHSTLITELTAEEAALIQGGCLVPDVNVSSTVNVSPTINVNVSPSIIVGVGGPAINTGQINNSGGGDNILAGGPGVVFQ